MPVPSRRKSVRGGGLGNSQDELRGSNTQRRPGSESGEEGEEGEQPPKMNIRSLAMAAVCLLRGGGIWPFSPIAVIVLTSLNIPGVPTLSSLVANCNSCTSFDASFPSSDSPPKM